MSEPSQQTFRTPLLGRSQFSSLFRREIAAYFLSPVSYIVWAVFLIASGYLFATSLRDGRQATMSGTFSQMALLLVFITPLTTMHLIAEELRLGTLEVLLSDPVAEKTIVAAKFGAAWLFILIVFVPTLAYPLVLAFTGQPDPGPVTAGYIGLALLGGLFAAVGLLASALSSSQFAAAAMSFTVLLLFWALGRAADALGPGTLGDVLAYLSAFSRFAAFRRGVVDTRTVIYCLSLTALCLLVATRLLQLRRLK